MSFARSMDLIQKKMGINKKKTQKRRNRDYKHIPIKHRK